MTPATISVPYSGNIHRVVLPNGLIVLAYHNPFVRSVNVMGSLMVGSAFEQADERMVATLTAEMLMRGTQHRDFDRIAADLEDIGAALDFGARTFSLSYSGKALAEDFAHLLEMVNELLRYPTFPAHHLALVQQEMTTSFQFATQDSRFRAGRALREAIYPVGYPLRQPMEGYLEALQSITPDKLHHFHQRTFTPQRMTLIVVGAVEPLLVEQEAMRVFGDWQGAAPATISYPTLTPPTVQQRLHTQLPGKTQSNILMGTLAPSRLSEDYLTATLANSILGEFGMMGRLGSSIREKSGLAYYANSGIETSIAQGVWSISAGVAHHNVELTVQKARDEVMRLTNELVSEDELADNQSYFTGSLPLQLESSAGIAGMLEGMERYALGFDYLLHYTDMVNAITREDVQKVASRYLNADAFIISTAGSTAAP